jgi:GNAT superfamily N-acetyltransferase
MTPYLVEERSPTLEEYRRLRAAVGWDTRSEEAMRRGLAGASYSCIVSSGGETIGCGRIVGDGGLYLYVQDVIVVPEHQGRGAGAAIMDALLGYLDREARPGTFVGLMAASGAAAFYERYGFERRPDDRPGMFRIW